MDPSLTEKPLIVVETSAQEKTTVANQSRGVAVRCRAELAP
jgi:hypothetical protein